MAQPRHLRNAPITEAIIDFRVKAAPEFDVKKFAELKPRFADQLPKMEEQRGFQAKFQIAKGQPQTPTLSSFGIHGYRFKSADDKTIAQFRVDGFTVNRLRPYTSWEELFPQAMQLWRLYCNLGQPKAVTRLALRYINRIELPGGNVDFDTYLRAGPIVPPEVPQSLSGFLTRVTIRDSGKNLFAHVSQALVEASAQNQQPTIILDIDAFKGGQFATDDPVIVRNFDELREFKNLIFFNYLTDEMLRKFE
jgi:uncharacterized protein (TIGR04255 family)